MRAIPIFICALFITTVACEQPGEFTPAEDPTRFSVSVLDSFRIESSTLLADSLITSGLPRLLVGRQKHSDLGDLKISSYFKFSPGDFLDFEGANMVYDSLQLILNYDGYVVGDKENTQQFEVREIVEEFGTEDDEFYFGFDKLNTGRDLLGSFSYDHDWEPGDSIFISMDDALGERLFEQAATNEVYSTNLDFLRDFEGLKIEPAGDEAHQVFGFANSTTANGAYENRIVLRMYYHEEGEFTEARSYDFVQIREDIAFSHYESERSGTELAGLRGDHPVVSSLSGDKTYIQAGLGIQSKIEFPFLKKLNELDKEYIVNAAILRISPVKGSYSGVAELPDSLALFITNKYNTIGQVFFNVSGGASVAQYASLKADDELNLYTYYEFDITEFVFQQLQEQGEQGLALIASATPSGILNTIDQLTIGGADYGTPGLSLKIYMTQLIE
ncbi:MAG: DUF4270 family protein [Roseivirga sp.]